MNIIEYKKTIYFIMFLVLIFAPSINRPSTVFATEYDVNNGTIDMVTEDDIVKLNEGTIINNYGSILTNKKIVKNNYGIISETISGNSIVEYNIGVISNSYDGDVLLNDSNGEKKGIIKCIGTKTSSCFCDVDENKGEIYYQYGAGTIDTNSGKIEVSQVGNIKVEKNEGEILLNNPNIGETVRAEVQENVGTITMKNGASAYLYSNTGTINKEPYATLYCPCLLRLNNGVTVTFKANKNADGTTHTGTERTDYITTVKIPWITDGASFTAYKEGYVCLVEVTGADIINEDGVYKIYNISNVVGIDITAYRNDLYRAKQLIEKANNLDSSLYTEVSFGKMLEAKDNLFGVVYNESATQAQVNEATDALEAAIKALVRIDGGSDDPDEPDDQEKVEKGKTYTVSGQSYKVTLVDTNSSKGTVSFIKAKNTKSVTVPNTVKLGDGKTYKVTAIASSAFKGSKIRSITVSGNIKKLSKNMCSKSKATTLILKTKKLKKSTVKGCLKGSKIKTVKVKVGSKSTNRKYVKIYKKIFTKKNVGRKVTVK